MPKRYRHDRSACVTVMGHAGGRGSSTRGMESIRVGPFLPTPARFDARAPTGASDRRLSSSDDRTLHPSPWHAESSVTTVSLAAIRGGTIRLWCRLDRIVSASDRTNSKPAMIVGWTNASLRWIGNHPVTSTGKATNGSSQRKMRQSREILECTSRPGRCFQAAEPDAAGAAWTDRRAARACRCRAI